MLFVISEEEACGESGRDEVGVSDDFDVREEGSFFICEIIVFGFCLSLFFKWVCHTFFISLSVLPGNFAAIADHLYI